MQKTSIYIPKGGTGKTCLAFALTKALNAYYTTNDEYNSVVALHQLKEQGTLAKANLKVPLGTEHLIYDAGKLIDHKFTKSSLLSSDCLIIPIEYDNISLALMKKLIEDFKRINDKAKIIVVINKFISTKISRSEAYLEVEKRIKDDQVKILFMSYTNLFETIQEKNVSIDEYVNSMPLFKHVYRNIINDFDNFYWEVTNLKDNSIDFNF